MKIILKFLAIFAFCHAAPVEIYRVKIECRQEITLKIECFLPASNEKVEVVEILSSAPLQSQAIKLSDDQVIS